MSARAHSTSGGRMRPTDANWQIYCKFGTFDLVLYGHVRDFRRTFAPVEGIDTFFLLLYSFGVVMTFAVTTRLYGVHQMNETHTLSLGFHGASNCMRLEITFWKSSESEDTNDAKLVNIYLTTVTLRRYRSASPKSYCRGRCFQTLRAFNI